VPEIEKEHNLKGGAGGGQARSKKTSERLGRSPCGELGIINLLSLDFHGKKIYQGEKKKLVHNRILRKRGTEERDRGKKKRNVPFRFTEKTVLNDGSYEEKSCS